MMYYISKTARHLVGDCEVVNEKKHYITSTIYISKKIHKAEIISQ